MFFNRQICTAAQIRNIVAACTNMIPKLQSLQVFKKGRDIVMRRFNKKLMIILITGSLFLTGCDIFRFETFDASKENTDQEVTLAPEEVEKDNDTDLDDLGSEEPLSQNSDDNNPETTPTPSLNEPIASIELPVFTVDAELGEIKLVTAMIPKGNEITPELIVETVVEAMADQSIMVGIENVTTENKTVIVSFYKDTAPVTGLGGSFEGAILNAIAQSLIDNLDNYSKVIFRIEGEAYVTGHIELGIDEVYMGDNN